MRKEHITLEVQDLLKQYATHPQVVALNTLLNNKTSRNIFLKGLNGSGAAMTIASLFLKRRGNYVCVLNDLEEAGYFYHDLVQLTGGDEIYFFPSGYRRAIKYGHVDPANEILRTEVLSTLQDPATSFVIVTYPDALAEKVISQKILKENTLKISVSEKLDNMFVSDVLDEYGFEQVDYVYEPGQYAVRGSILDVFSFSYEFPYRIDFFGNEVETIRSFDVETQLSKEKLDSIFEQFYRLDTGRGSSGNGLGLAIAKQIITLHKGTITVESGDGLTVFTVTLPILQQKGNLETTRG